MKFQIVSPKLALCSFGHTIQKVPIIEWDHGFQQHLLIPYDLPFYMILGDLIKFFIFNYNVTIPDNNVSKFRFRKNFHFSLTITL